MTISNFLRPFAGAANLIESRLADVWTWASVFRPMPMNLLELWGRWVINSYLGIDQ